jgi:hypothetical protein
MTSSLCSGDCYNQTLALNNWLHSRPYSADIIPSASSPQALVIFVLFGLIKIVSIVCYYNEHICMYVCIYLCSYGKLTCRYLLCIAYSSANIPYYFM